MPITLAVLFNGGNTEGACLLNKLYCENIPEQVHCSQDGWHSLLVFNFLLQQGLMGYEYIMIIIIGYIMDHEWCDH